MSAARHFENEYSHGNAFGGKLERTQQRVAEQQPAADHRDSKHKIATGKVATALGRYRDLQDGTVLDVETGLRWMRCALGHKWYGETCRGTATEYSWGQVLRRVWIFNLLGGFAGHRDWRVPTIEELSTITGGGFPDAQGWFWSSSPDANDSNRARGVAFTFDYVDSAHKWMGGYVRLVRGVATASVSLSP